jgi:hypothetical protein|tara:strand:+ start:73 stop:282 length:210 start_codon:yes stop_codon:yes gene_type:complete
MGRRRIKKPTNGGVKPRLISQADHMIGDTHRMVDIAFKALKPGKRISKSGKIYYEYRRNRADWIPKTGL